MLNISSKVSADALTQSALPKSNQTGEIAAVVVALQTIPTNVDLTIITDSQYVIKTLTHSLEDYENSAWVNIPNSQWLRTAVYLMRSRAAPTRFKWTKGHNGERGNEGADQLATIGVNKTITDHIDLNILAFSEPSGMRLSSLTQAQAYKLLRTLTVPPSRRRTEILLDRTRSALEDINGAPPKDESIWCNAKHPDIRRPVQSFLFRALHGSLRIGDFWSDIPNFEQRAFCPTCRDTHETLEHILLDCPHGQANTIWALAKLTWPTTLGPWPETHLGTILGCGSIRLPSQQNNSRPDRGKSRLLRILLSESAHLIWVLRCENVIQGKTHAKEATTRRWYNKMNQRLSLDHFIAAKWNKKPVT